LRGYIPDLETLDVIPKTNELLLKDKERIIINGGEKFVSYYGAECARLNARFKEVFSLDNWMKYPIRSGKAVVGATWGSGTTPEERGQWYDLATTIRCDEGAATACGDDIAGTVNLNGYCYGIESDASNWDHSQILYPTNEGMQGMLNVQYYYYRILGASDDLVNSLSRAGLYGLKWSNGKRVNECESIKAILGYTRRASGLVDTTDGNTINMLDMMCNILAWLINNVESHWEQDVVISWIKETTVNLGAIYGVKLKVIVHLNPRHMTFLKGFYVDARVNGERKSIWYPSPEILMKIGSSEANPDNSPAYIKACKLKRVSNKEVCKHLRVYDILQSWKTFKGMPMLDSLLRMVKPPFGGITYEESRARIADLDKWDKPELFAQVSDQDFEPMLETLNIKDLVIDFDKLIENVDWTPGMYITHPIVGVLASRYS
jgi:hypothetical protein